MSSIPFLEKDLETILYEAPPDKIQSRGLSEFYYDRIARQYHLGKYGIADLVTFSVQSYSQRCNREYHRNIDITVYELKQDKIDINTFIQGIGYMKGLAELAKTFNMGNTSVSFDLILIGRLLDLRGNFSFIPDLLSKVAAYTYDYHFDGVHFNKVENYQITDNTFSEQTINRSKNIGLDLVRKTQHYQADNLPF